MIIRRRAWFYRLAGEHFAHAVTFRIPMTAQKVRESLRRTVGVPVELWGHGV